MEMRDVCAPYKHQIEAFTKAERLNAFALFMEQGTGKTKVALMRAFSLYSKGLIDRVLIICPSALKNQWVGEQLEEHLATSWDSIQWDGFSSKEKKRAFNEFLESKELKIMAINYEALLPKAKAIFYVNAFTRENKDRVFVICDESTKIKNPIAQRTKSIISLFKNAKYKAILTGTPTPNSPFDLYSQFEFLYPGFWGMKFFHFKKYYCIMVKRMNPSTGRPFNAPIEEHTWKWAKNKLNNLEKKEIEDIERIAIQTDLSIMDVLAIDKTKEYTPYKNMEKLRALIDPYTFKVMKKDCLDLPAKIYEKLEVDLSAEQKRAMKELKKELITTYEGKELTASNILSVTCRLQMITGGVFPYQVSIVDNDGFIEKETHFTYFKDNPKIKALLDDLENISGDTQVIIWASFVAELELIYKTLKDNKESCALYYGKTPQKERKQIEDDFKKGKIRILVINPALGEMGLNFQNCHLHYFYSNSFQADRRLQAEDRSHRIGQNNKVTYKDIICLKSIDQRILEAIKRKESIINYFRDKNIMGIID